MKRELFSFPVGDGRLFYYAPALNFARIATVAEREQVKQELAASNRTPQPPHEPAKLKPSILNSDKLVIGLTSKCNLRCDYCYADGGDYTDTMDIKVLDGLIAAAPSIAARHDQRMEVSFFSDGETLMEQGLLWYACEQFHVQSEIYNFKLKMRIITNATLVTSKNIANFKRWIDNVQISFDGVFGSDTQRRLPNGEGSTGLVMRGINLLRDQGIVITLRCTITAATVEMMESMVAFAIENTHSKYIQFEPAKGVDRNGQEMSPHPHDFVRNYIKAFEYGAVRGFKVATAMEGTNKNTTAFCGISAPNLDITSDGSVTACVRHTHNPESKYMIGHFDTELGDVVTDPEKVRFLQEQTTVDTFPECRSCFAKYHCAGGCGAARDLDDGTHYVCAITQPLTAYMLMKKYERREFANLRRNANYYTFTYQTVVSLANSFGAGSAYMVRIPGLGHAIPYVLAPET